MRAFAGVKERNGTSKNRATEHKRRGGKKGCNLLPGTGDDLGRKAGIHPCSMSRLLPPRPSPSSRSTSSSSSLCQYLPFLLLRHHLLLPLLHHPCREPRSAAMDLPHVLSDCPAPLTRTCADWSVNQRRTPSGSHALSSCWLDSESDLNVLPNPFQIST